MDSTIGITDAVRVIVEKGGVLGGLLIIFLFALGFLVRYILKDRSDTVTFERSQVISTTEWLRREELRNGEFKEEIRQLKIEHEEEIKDLILKHTKETANLIAEHTSETNELKTIIKDLRKVVNDLTEEKNRIVYAFDEFKKSVRSDVRVIDDKVNNQNNGQA